MSRHLLVPEPSNIERGEWPETTREYVEDLETLELENAARINDLESQLSAAQQRVAELEKHGKALIDEMIKRQNIVTPPIPFTGDIAKLATLRNWRMILPM